MFPQYQVNLGSSDPILMRRDIPNYYNNIQEQIDYLENLKQDYNNRQQKPVTRKENNWNKIDNELATLNDEQKKILFSDANYQAFDAQLQGLIQQELLNLVKDKIAVSSTGEELLAKMLDYVRTVKPKVIAESNKDLELFKKFQLAVKVNPNLTYPEFIKSLNKE